MKAISTKTSKGLQVGSKIKCVDNTGAKEVQIISVQGFKGIRRRNPRAGVADVVTCAITKGNQKIMHEVSKAVIVRQRKEYKRPSGIRVAFNDNAAILVQDDYEPKGKEIRGAIAKEVVERFPTIGKIASIII